MPEVVERYFVKGTFEGVAHLDATRYKLYMADSGLLVSMLDEESQEDLRLRRDIGTWKGGLFENVVAEALVKSGAVPAYYKTSVWTFPFLCGCVGGFLARRGRREAWCRTCGGKARRVAFTAASPAMHWATCRFEVGRVSRSAKAT